MKKFRILLLSALVLFTACDKDDINDDDDSDPVENLYTGILSVDQNNGTVYYNEDLDIAVEINGNSMTMVLKNVRFAEAMPITLTMTVNDIPVQTTDTQTRISGDNLVPLALGGEFPQYTINNLQGELSEEGCVFLMECGKYTVSFIGVGENVSIPPVEGGRFTGISTTDQNDGTYYTHKDGYMDVTVNHDQTLTVIMRGAKFAEKMPATDITFTGVETEKGKFGLTLIGEEIIPEALGVPVERYTITGLTGLLTGETVSLSMQCGPYPTAFLGIIE